jgi:hypothetical protein
VDAGDASAEVDAASDEANASTATDGGCDCGIARRSDGPARGLIASAWGILLLISMRKRWPLVVVLIGLATALGAVGCGDDGSMNEPSDEADAATFVACPDSIPELEPGVAFAGRDGKIRVEILEASPMPARKHRNDWTIALTDADGEPLDDVEITRLEAYMPVHKHFSRPEAEVEVLEGAGQLNATVHFIMRGPWEVQLEASSASAGDDYVVLDVCVEN